MCLLCIIGYTAILPIRVIPGGGTASGEIRPPRFSRHCLFLLLLPPSFMLAVTHGGLKTYSGPLPLGLLSALKGFYVFRVLVLALLALDFFGDDLF